MNLGGATIQSVLSLMRWILSSQMRKIRPHRFSNLPGIKVSKWQSHVVPWPCSQNLCPAFTSSTSTVHSNEPLNIYVCVCIYIYLFHVSGRAVKVIK